MNCRLGIALVVLAVGACGSSRPAPVSALDAYGAALAQGDYDRAYDMMSAEYRRTHTKEEFLAQLEGNEREVAETAGRLRGPHREVRIVAELAYGAGEEVELVLEQGQWKVASNPVEFYSQATPRDALRAFLRAYAMQRWDVMLRLAPTQYAEQMTPELVQEQFEGERKEQISQMMGALEANVDAPIEVKGAQATMPYGASSEVKFVKEGELWKIQDPD